MELRVRAGFIYTVSPVADAVENGFTHHLTMQSTL